MKKIILILVVLLNSIATYAQIGGLDTLTESKRNEILLKAFKDKLLKTTHLTECYSDTEIPIIYDLGIWKDGDDLKLGVDKYAVLIGRRLYAVAYPSSEESLKYYPRIKHKIIVFFDSESGRSIYSYLGPTRKNVNDMKVMMHRRDSFRQLRLEYLEKERRLKKMEDSIEINKLEKMLDRI